MKGGGGVINYNTPWSYSVTNECPSCFLSNDYREYSCNAFDFVYFRHDSPITVNGTQTTINFINSPSSGIYLYTNGIPITNERYLIFNRNSENVCIFFVYYTGVPGEAIDKLNISLQGELVSSSTPSYFLINDTHHNFINTVDSPVFSFFTMKMNYNDRIIKNISLHFSSETRTSIINDLTLTILRFSRLAPPSGPEYPVTSYFKEDSETELIQVTKAYQQTKFLWTQHSITCDSLANRTFAYLGQGSDNEQKNYKDSLYSSCIIGVITAEAINDEPIGPILQDYTENVIYGDNSAILGGNIYFNPPLYNNCGKNYTIITPVYKRGKCVKLATKLKPGVTGGSLLYEFYSNGHQKYKNINAQYSPRELNLHENIFTDNNNLYSPYEENTGKTTNLLTTQIIAGKYMYISFMCGNQISNTPFMLRSGNCNSLGSKIDGIQYNWANTNLYFYHDDSDVIVFLEYNLSSDTVNNYIDTTIRFTIEPETNSEPSFDPARTIDIDIIRYSDFGYPEEKVNLDSNIFCMIGKIKAKDIVPKLNYHMYLYIVNNDESKVKINTCKIFMIHA